MAAQTGARRDNKCCRIFLFTRETRAQGAFLSAGVESIGLECVGQSGADDVSSSRSDAMLLLGTVIEGLLRSLSAVVERLHHSSAFYLLLSPSRFVPAAVYLPVCALLIVSPLLSAVGNASLGISPHRVVEAWADAVIAFIITVLVGLLSGALLGGIVDAHGGSPPSRVAVAAWALLSSVLLFVSHYRVRTVVLSTNVLRALILGAVSVSLLYALLVNTPVMLPIGVVTSPAVMLSRPLRGWRGSVAVFSVVAAPLIVLAGAAAFTGVSLEVLCLRARLADPLLWPLTFCVMLPAHALAVRIITARKSDTHTS